MSSQIQLMGARRFWPIFWTQFLGAFNDNLLKTAASMLIAYKGLTVWGIEPAAMSTVAPALLMVPYIFFSGIAGQMADRYSKSWLVQRVKVAEIAIVTMAAVGFLYHMPQLLLVSILLLGLEATFFGPIKYSILPQLLTTEELVTGNALVEMGTNIAVLLGTIAGGYLALKATFQVSVTMIVLAVLGYLATRFLPQTKPEAPDLPLDLNPATTTMDIVRQGFKIRSIALSLLGIGWFWLYGSALLALFYPYAHDVLHAGEDVVTLALALFSIGVAVGSLLCEKLSFGRLELGLVPFGSIGMTLFAADLYFAWKPTPMPEGQFLTVAEFVSHAGGYRVMIDLVLLAVSSGFFIVPLYTFIQERADAEARSRVVAANNIISSLFIVAWAGIQVALLKYFPVTTIFMFVATLNAIVALYIYSVIPEFFLRFVAYLLTRVLYRVKVSGLQNIPRATPNEPLEGAAVLVCNHVSFIDWLIVYGAVPRPVRFVMHASYAQKGFLGKLLRDAKVILIATRSEDAATRDQAMVRVAEELAQGELVCIFPEGMVTHTGDVNQFRRGIEEIVGRTPVRVIPMALQGLWGSYFSYKHGKPMSAPFRRFWSRLALVVGEPVAPTEVKADDLRERVLALRGDTA